MKVPILEGVYTSDQANFLTSYPINYEPIIGENGISEGYLRSYPGIEDLGVTGPGADRGAILWQSHCHRVMGTKLVRLSGGSAPTILGTIPDTDIAVLDYGFDRLAIVAGGTLHYWDGAALTEVTDPNLGAPLGLVWIDGYYVTTDGTYIIVTNLNDPYTINPLRYGSSEADPDPILAVNKVRDELYALNQNTIENFQNVGGAGFPFQRNPGGLIPKGICGRHAWSYFLDTFAFVGGGRDEAESVWLAGLGQAISITTPQIDREIAAVPFADRLQIECEAVQDKGEQRLMIHLPTVNKTLVYFRQASLAAQRPVWTILRGGVNADQAYPGRHFCFAEDFWFCGTETDGKLGVLNESLSYQWGTTAGRRFDTAFLYNASRGAILQSAELIGLPGRMFTDAATTGFLSWTQDGETWSQERAINLGTQGQRLTRMQWRPKTKFSNYMGLRFRFANDAVDGFARLEVQAEALNA